MTKFVTKQVGEIFKKIATNPLPYATSELPTRPMGDYTLAAITSKTDNQGRSVYVPKTNATILDHVITIASNGDAGSTFYQTQAFTILQDSYAIKLKDKYQKQLSTNNYDYVYLYFTTLINKFKDNYNWNKKAIWEREKQNNIQVPVTSDDKLDTEYMAAYVKKIEAAYVKKIEAAYVKKIEAYLAVLGYKSLADCQLDPHDLDVLHAKPKMGGFKAIKMFDQPIRGKRIKSDDRITGTLPFITAGVDKQGISAYIGNNTHIFPKNSITIDMFGNVFYRYFQYGADDHVTVLTSNKYNKKQMLYLTSCLSKSLSYNQYTYSKNFYPKDVTAITLSLPVTPSGTPDWQFMEDYITAIEKLKVLKIKQFLDTKINAYQNIIK